MHLSALDEDGNYLVKIIGDANKGMEDLVNDMLVLSRLLQSEIRREVVDLSEIACGVAAELLLAEPGRVVEFVVAPEHKFFVV